MFCGAGPVLNSVTFKLDSQEEEMLAARYFDSSAVAAAVGGDWLTRVIDAQQVGQILTSQEEWGTVLGLPVCDAEEVVREEKLAEGLSERCCQIGLIVPGPGYSLIEAFKDRVAAEAEELSSAEAAAVAILACAAFDVIKWPAYGTGAIDDEEWQVYLTGPYRPTYVDGEELKELVLDTIA